MKEINFFHFFYIYSYFYNFFNQHNIKKNKCWFYILTFFLMKKTFFKKILIYSLLFWLINPIQSFAAEYDLINKRIWNDWTIIYENNDILTVWRNSKEIWLSFDIEQTIKENFLIVSRYTASFNNQSERIKEWDYFQLKLDKKLTFNEFWDESEVRIKDLVQDWIIIAKPNFDYSNRIITYIFTKESEDIQNLNIDFTLEEFVKKEYINSSWDYSFNQEIDWRDLWRMNHKLNLLKEWSNENISVKWIISKYDSKKNQNETKYFIEVKKVMNQPNDSWYKHLWNWIYLEYIMKNDLSWEEPDTLSNDHNLKFFKIKNWVNVKDNLEINESDLEDLTDTLIKQSNWNLRLIYDEEGSYHYNLYDVVSYRTENNVENWEKYLVVVTNENNERNKEENWIRKIDVLTWFRFWLTSIYEWWEIPVAVSRLNIDSNEIIRNNYENVEPTHIVEEPLLEYPYPIQPIEPPYEPYFPVRNYDYHDSVNIPLKRNFDLAIVWNTEQLNKKIWKKVIIKKIDDKWKILKWIKFNIKKWDNFIQDENWIINFETWENWKFQFDIEKWYDYEFIEKDFDWIEKYEIPEWWIVYKWLNFNNINWLNNEIEIINRVKNNENEWKWIPPIVWPGWNYFIRNDDRVRKKENDWKVIVYYKDIQTKENIINDYTISWKIWIKYDVSDSIKDIEWYKYLNTLFQDKMKWTFQNYDIRITHFYQKEEPMNNWDLDEEDIEDDKDYEIKDRESWNKFSYTVILPETWSEAIKKVWIKKNRKIQTELNEELFNLKWEENTDLNFWLKNSNITKWKKKEDWYIVIKSKWLIIPLWEIKNDIKDKKKLWKILSEWSMKFDYLTKNWSNEFWEIWTKFIWWHSSYFKWNKYWEYKTHFQKIIWLEEWEEIWVYKKEWNSYKRYVYKVESSYNKENSKEMTIFNNDIDRLVLFTCTPIWWVSWRWIVESKFLYEDDRTY